MSTIRKLYLCCFHALFLLNAAYSQPTDTVKVEMVAGGILHSTIFFPSIPLTVNVLKIDLSVPGLDVVTVKAARDGNERLFARETVSSMAHRVSSDTMEVVAAINGDFYDVESGAPMNLQIKAGEVVKLHNSVPPKTGFGITRERNHFLERLLLEGKLLTRWDSVLTLEAVNNASTTCEAVLFNHFYGERTGTTTYGTILWLRLISEPIVGDTVYATVDSVVDLSGNVVIEPGRYVLIARGGARHFVLRNVRMRDTVRFVITAKPAVGRITEALGGWPRIVREGKNTVRVEAELEEAILANTDRRHPRTAVGISRDAKTLYLVVVDGRQANSVGMTLNELADFLLQLGVHDALNLDGGGSSTMVVKGRVVNSPSDPTGERPVSNALLVRIKKQR
jgi:hypothetical protein